jgi:2-keto-3-deoxy-L-rhamnonate aldolase RhmA
MKNLKQRIYAGETVHGSWINLGSHVSAEIMAYAGFDWLLIDMEHGAVDFAIMYQQLQVLENSEASIVVRTDEPSRSKVQKILDAGAAGIMFPQFRNGQEAEQAVNSMYYPPRGGRGMAKMVRAMRFGLHADAYIGNLEKNLVSIIQIETLDAIKNIDAIASTSGVDVLFVGPNDLSLALGIFGQLQHKLYQDAIRTVADAARKHGKVPGVLLQDVNEYEMYAQLGYRFLGCGADATFVSKGARDMVNQLKLKRK